MSGIFKGDSIYKSGGGGGGYKDGGALVDGDFIEVENNTISSYDNVSRDPVNFYFEVKDGEILNSVVELTTAVNATINVYVVKNGFYYLLGNVGGNTVNAGDDYKINIVGNSFMLEVVTPSQAIPEFAEINGNVYPIIELNGYLWTKKNIAGDFGLDFVEVPTNGNTVYVDSKFYNIAKCGSDFYYRGVNSTRTAINNACAPFKIPTFDDFTNSGFLSQTCSNLTSDESDSTGFSAVKKAWIVQASYTPSNRYLYRDNSSLNKWAFVQNNQNAIRYTSSASVPEDWGSGDWLVSLRLCCKLSDL